MNNNGDIDLLAALRKLMAETKSQEARLEEYSRIIDSRDKEIEMLQTMLSEANEYRSTLDNQLRELKDLQSYIGDLQQQVAGTVYLATGRQQQVPVSVSVESRLENLNQEYAYLQVQLTSMQEQLLEMNNRNLVLTQQTGRIAELESLLENATNELSKFKGRPKPTG